MPFKIYPIIHILNTLYTSINSDDRNHHTCRVIDLSASMVMLFLDSPLASRDVSGILVQFLNSLTGMEGDSMFFSVLSVAKYELSSVTN